MQKLKAILPQEQLRIRSLELPLRNRNLGPPLRLRKAMPVRLQQNRSHTFSEEERRVLEILVRERQLIRMEKLQRQEQRRMH